MHRTQKGHFAMTARRTNVKVGKTRSRRNVIEMAATERTSQRARDKRPRSAVTSGRKLFVNGDPNSAWARRWADLVRGYIADAGGRDFVSEGRLALIKRAAGLECELEQLEGRMSLGENVDLDLYGRAAGQLRRILEVLGLDRRAVDITRRAQEDREAGLIP
jgi:hypothetical protein